MSRLRIFLVFCLLAGMAVPALALDLQEGMHGMKWGCSASEPKNLTKVRESGAVAYYVPSDTRFLAADQMVPTVVYGFYKDRFFATYIKLGSPVQFNNLKRHFSGKYGTPKLDHISADQQTVLRWKVSDVNIKLKLKEPGRDIKMSVYYVPLAGELNREQLEDIPSELYRETVPAEKQAAGGKELLD